MKINKKYISKRKKILMISIFLFKASIDLKSWLIIPKGQLNARQLFLILKVNEFLKFFGCHPTPSIIMMRGFIKHIFKSLS